MFGGHKIMAQQINLHNFFKFYDENNPKHVNAIEELKKSLPAEALLDDANWVRIYRSRINENLILLNVPFYPQTDNYRDADRTCNSSSCAMCLEYFKPGTLKGEKGDDEYIKKVFQIGDSTDHSVQTKILNSYGVRSSFHYNLTFDDIDRSLNARKPVVLGILHRGSLSAPTGGHMIVCVGKTKYGDYIFNDPYGSLNDGYTSSVYNGKSVIYKKSVLQKRWIPEGPSSGWGRLF